MVGGFFFVGWVGYLSFVCRCSHPVSQMDKGGYSSVDTSSSATVNKPSLLRRVVSSSIASMGKPTKRSILIEKIQFPSPKKNYDIDIKPTNKKSR